MITITKNGYIHFKNKCVSNNVVLTMLAEKVTLDKDFTLNSFFKMLNLYPEIARLEAYTQLYVDYYNESGLAKKDFPLDKGKKIQFNSYFLENEGESCDKKHNLTVKHLSGFICNPSQYQIHDLLGSRLILGEKIIKFKIEFDPLTKEKKFVRLPELHQAKNPCDLFSFIMYMGGSLFVGKSPDKRVMLTELTQLTVDNISSDIFSEIEKIVLNKNA